MSIKILYVTATSQEAEAIIKKGGILPVPGGYSFGNFDINLLVTGVVYGYNTTTTDVTVAIGI